MNIWLDSIGMLEPASPLLRTARVPLSVLSAGIGPLLVWRVFSECLITAIDIVCLGLTVFLLLLLADKAIHHTIAVALCGVGARVMLAGATDVVLSLECVTSALWYGSEYGLVTYRCVGRTLLTHIQPVNIIINMRRCIKLILIIIMMLLHRILL